MQVLYINNYRDGTGWAQAGQEYMRALKAAGVHVVPRCIKLNTTNGFVYSDIAALEGGKLGDNYCTVQHVLPYIMTKTDKLDIGVFISETLNLKHTGWHHNLELMDKLVIPNQYQISEIPSLKSFSIIPHPINHEKWNQKYNPLPVKEVKDTFVFYSIGEFSRRKNFTALIKAFHMEFMPEEPVSLVIKTNCADTDFHNLCDDLKQNKLRLRKRYKPEIVITQHLTEQQMCELHELGDCFVMPSRGEAFCIPAGDAIAAGNPIIVTEGTGMAQLALGNTIKATKEPIFFGDGQFDNLYTGHEYWMEPSLTSLREEMRAIYNLSQTKQKFNDLRSKYIAHSFKFDYNTIGAKFRSILYEKI